MKSLPLTRVKDLLRRIRGCRILVIGDLMLDQFIWGRVMRISPEAPVPIVEFESESLMPGGAANVARNLAVLRATAELHGVVGKDNSAKRLLGLLKEQAIDCAGIQAVASRSTSVKTRIIAFQQQVVRVDRESAPKLETRVLNRIWGAVRERLDEVDAVILGDYGKGVVSQELLDRLKEACREKGLWLSLDPKPIHALDLAGLSLITPNRKEAFELAGLRDDGGHGSPLEDASLMAMADRLFEKLSPALLLITLGDKGMLLCQKNEPRFHIPTIAQEVFDVSGAGDTVIGSFTAAIAAGASPIEAAVFSNHAAGIVVGKVGTATASPEEIVASFEKQQ